MALINIIQPENARGHLAEIYKEIYEKRGKAANVIKISSTNPEMMQQHLNLYLSIMFGKSPLKRYQREMMAVVVSSANTCNYCKIHHSEALNHFWKDKQKVNLLSEDFMKVSLTTQDSLLCKFASELTKNPGLESNKEIVYSLKKAGMDDRAIHDATSVIGYFNFVNRMVLGLDIELEQDKGKGYKFY